MPLAIHSTRRHWMQLCTLFAFVLALTWVSSARAAVPMCGSRAQTVAAPPIGTPASSASLSASPCEPSALLRIAGVPEREAPEKLSLPDLPIRALPLLPRFPNCPERLRLAPGAPDHTSLPAGFARSIERPPRG